MCGAIRSMSLLNDVSSGSGLVSVDRRCRCKTPSRHSIPDLAIVRRDLTRGDSGRSAAIRSHDISYQAMFEQSPFQIRAPRRRRRKGRLHLFVKGTRVTRADRDRYASRVVLNIGVCGDKMADWPK